MGKVVQLGEMQSRGTVALARWLLGKVLVRSGTEQRQEYMICEV